MGPLVPVEVFDSVGCAACHGTGFRGRVAIFETFWIDHELGRQISNGVPEDVILRIAIGKGKGGSAGLTPLRMDGLNKILAGITTVESVAAATTQTEGLLDICPSYSMSP